MELKNHVVSTRLDQFSRPCLKGTEGFAAVISDNNINLI
jgi:hypothetical protein